MKYITRQKSGFPPSSARYLYEYMQEEEVRSEMSSSEWPIGSSTDAGNFTVTFDSAYEYLRQIQVQLYTEGNNFLSRGDFNFLLLFTPANTSINGMDNGLIGVKVWLTNTSSEFNITILNQSSDIISADDNYDAFFCAGGVDFVLGPGQTSIAVHDGAQWRIGEQAGGDSPVYDNPVTYNSTATYNGPTTYNNTATFNGPTNFTTGPINYGLVGDLILPNRWAKITRTSLPLGVSSGTAESATVTSLNGIWVGVRLFIEDGGFNPSETVTVISVGPGLTFEANFAHNHEAGATVTGAPTPVGPLNTIHWPGSWYIWFEQSNVVNMQVQGNTWLVDPNQNPLQPFFYYFGQLAKDLAVDGHDVTLVVNFPFVFFAGGGAPPFIPPDGNTVAFNNQTGIWWWWNGTTWVQIPVSTSSSNLLYSQVTPVTVANTATETTILDNTPFILANTATVGTLIRFSIRGVVSTGSLGAGASIRIYIGTGNLVINTVGGFDWSYPLNMSNNPFHIQADLVYRTIGATPTSYGQGEDSWLGTSGDTQAQTVIDLIDNSNVFDTTISQPINITVQWGDASPSYSVTVQTCTIEQINNPLYT